MLAREPGPFWRENVVAVVTLLRVLVRTWVEMGKTSYQMLEVLSRFIILRSGEVVTSFTKGNSANLKNGKIKLLGSLYFDNTRKNFKSNLVLVVVPVL